MVVGDGDWGQETETTSIERVKSASAGTVTQGLKKLESSPSAAKKVIDLRWVRVTTNFAGDGKGGTPFRWKGNFQLEPEDKVEV